MSYSISSDQLTHPLLKPIFKEVNAYFLNTGIQFFVIGAAARDIYIQLYDRESKTRLTYDLDLAIAINDWSQFETVEKGLLSLGSFTKDPQNKQRFIYQNQFIVDIVPFGAIMNHEEKISWPPDDQVELSVIGYPEVEAATIKVKLDDEIIIRIATFDGIFFLKIIAWEDRNLSGNRDAEDIGFILKKYLGLHELRASQYYDEVYAEPFSRITGGSVLLAKDIVRLVGENSRAKTKFINIIKGEIELSEESKLINQILETHNELKYEEVYASLKNIIKELE
jgi:predicted nucleotidyltransferase